MIIILNLLLLANHYFSGYFKYFSKVFQSRFEQLKVTQDEQKQEYDEMIKLKNTENSDLSRKLKVYDYIFYGIPFIFQIIFVLFHWIKIRNKFQFYLKIYEDFRET